MPHDESGSVADLVQPGIRALAANERAKPSLSDRVSAYSFGVSQRTEQAGWWGRDVWEQVSNYKGAVALAIQPYLDYFLGAKYQAFRKRPKSVRKSVAGGFSKFSRDDDYEPLEDDHPVSVLLREPGGESGAFTLGYEMCFGYLQYLITGSAPFWLPPNADGKPCQLYALVAAHLLPATPPGADTAYPQGAYRIAPASGYGWTTTAQLTANTLLPAEQVRVMRKPHPLSRHWGMSPMQLGAKQIDLLNAIVDFQWSYFNEGVALDTVVTLPGADAETVTRVRDSLLQKHGGARKARALAVFGGAAGMEGGKGATVQNLAPSPKEMDFANGREVALQEVMAFFGTPKLLAGYGDSSNYATYIGQLRMFRDMRLKPAFEGVGEFLTRHLAKPWQEDGEEIVIAAEPQIPKDEDQERQELQSALQAGAITVNEYRLATGRDPYDNGDVPLSVYVQVKQQEVAPPPQAVPGTDPTAPPGADAAPVPGGNQLPGDSEQEMGGSDAESGNPDDSEQGTQEATLQAALAALGMGGTGAGSVAKGFDPNERRDESGKWTSGGSGGSDEPESQSSQAARDDYAKNGVRAKAFKQWFGDWENDPDNASKIVDSDGKPQETYGTPMRVFHGTNADFMEFDSSKIKIDNLGRGFYFTSDRQIADSYASRRSQERGGAPKVVEAYLRVVKPFDFRNVTEEQARDFLNFYYSKSQLSEHDAARAAADELADVGGNYAALFFPDQSEMQEWLSSRGYDGLIVPGKDKSSGKEGVAFVVFRPEQIKSTSNEGTFDASSPKFNKAKLPAKPGGAPARARQEGEVWTSAKGERWTKRNGKVVPAPQPGGSGTGGPGASATRPAGQSAPAPAQPQPGAQRYPSKFNEAITYGYKDDRDADDKAFGKDIRAANKQVAALKQKLAEAESRLPDNHPVVKQARAALQAATEKANAARAKADSLKGGTGAGAGEQQSDRTQLHAEILKKAGKGAKAFGLTAEILAKMPPAAVDTIAVQLGISKPEQHYATHAAAVPVTPRSQPVLQRAHEWADSMAQKHAARVAQRLGIKPELAQKILAKAIRQVAEHALKNGGKASGTLKVGGQSLRVGVKAPQGEPGGAKDGAAERDQPGIAKAMNTLSDPDGGFLVPPGNMPRRKRKKRRSVCDVVRKALEGVA